MKKLMLITSMALGLMGVGCSKSNSGSSNTNGYVNGYTYPGDPTNPVILGSSDTTTTTITDMFSSGFTTAFTPKNMTVFTNYTTISGNLTALNAPTNFQLNVDLTQSESGRYGGEISIGYTDGGVTRIGTFRAGTGRNQSLSGMYDNNRLEADYNYWYDASGKQVFTAFFEDTYGSMILTMQPDPDSDTGNDAEPMDVKYKGSVYFRNFSTPKSNPYRSCWFIYVGVFDCRDSAIQNKTSLTPGSGYTLLGSFKNLEVKKAFNMDTE